MGMRGYKFIINRYYIINVTALISAITKVCLEIFLKWDPETITIASNSDVKKISYHISTTEPEIRRCNDTNNKITEAELKLKLVEKLLQKASIEVFDLSYPSETFSDIFSLKRIVTSYCSLCEREHTNENAYIIQYKKIYSYYCYCADQEKLSGKRKLSIKLAFSKSALNQKKFTSSKCKDKKLRSFFLYKTKKKLSKILRKYGIDSNEITKILLFESEPVKIDDENEELEQCITEIKYRMGIIGSATSRN
ncbi:hypothetical protein RhiirA5_414014 [Rhizophagus irregularis]|uniref:Uncharacterized protein n=1 Tax=Rhizophagus irregularis TaxID=588596 RepID=A0A2N0PV69_9GLOM|nr:hypothetical protein RhiirA5_414014 [Rhizophagus irregularis]